jgi:hypothetical protein
MNSDHTKGLRQGLQALALWWPNAAIYSAQLETKNKRFDYNQIGLNYDNNDWWLQGEYVRLGSELALVSAGQHAYLSMGKRFGSLSLYALTGYAEPENPLIVVQQPLISFPDPIGQQIDYLARATERSLNGVRIKQRSYGLGARWDFAAKMALKIQLEQFDVDNTGTNLWLRTDSGQIAVQDPQSTVLSLALDVLF